MKQSLIFTLFLALVWAFPGSAQEIQNMQAVETTSFAPQQGRATLDSDTNESDDDSTIPTHTPEWTSANEGDPGDSTDAGESVQAPDDTQESSTGYVKLGDIKGESEDSSEETTGRDIEAPEDPQESAAWYIKIDDIEGESEDSSDGIEDLNSGEDEPQEMNKAELVTELATEPVESRAIFIKIDDIKGESEDTTSGKDGDAETTWKVEEGESTAAKKPKEIVVVGSKVRGWDPVKKEEIVGAAPESPEDVETYEDLTLFLAATANADENIEDVKVTPTEIEINYNTDFKLLGIIPMELPSVFTIDMDPDSDEHGRVKVKFPWYRVLGSAAVDTNAIAMTKVESRDENELVDTALRTKSLTDLLLGS